MLSEVLNDLLKKMEIETEVFSSLLLSYPEALRAVRNAAGGTTKYQHISTKLVRITQNLIQNFFNWVCFLYVSWVFCGEVGGAVGMNHPVQLVRISRSNSANLCYIFLQIFAKFLQMKLCLDNCSCGCGYQDFKNCICGCGYDFLRGCKAVAVAVI